MMLQLQNKPHPHCQLANLRRFNKLPCLINSQTDEHVESNQAHEAKECNEDCVGHHGEWHMLKALIPILIPSQRRTILEEHLAVLDLSGHHHHGFQQGIFRESKFISVGQQHVEGEPKADQENEDDEEDFEE